MSEVSLSKKEIQNRLNSIRINAEGFTSRKYGVSIKYYSNDDEKPEKRVDYEVNVVLERINGIGYVTINKENIFYNQHEPDLISEKIAQAITKSLYPVKTHINEKGISSDEIINHSEVIDRWNLEKRKIQEKYSSTELEDFFETTEKVILNKSRLESSLKNDFFWNLFFHRKLINYGNKRTVETELFLPIIPYEYPFRFVGEQKIEKIPTYFHSFTIHFQSKEVKAPKYFYPKNHNESNGLFMNLNVQFESDLYHHFPMHIIAELKIYSKEKSTENSNLKRIAFSMYQINADEYKTKKLSQDSPFITGGLVKLPPNKWGFDNFENLENDW